jgi:AcrR family transcriptional regulator
MATQRENILTTATQLFYEQGYDKTSFQELADLLDITKSLISYHFKSKSLLAKAVTERYSVNNKNAIAFKLYQQYFSKHRYDLQLSSAVEIRLSTELFFRDPNAARYIIETLNGNYEDAYISHYKQFYIIHDRQYHLNINPDIDEISLLARGASGASQAVITDYINGNIDCTMNECLDYIVEMIFRFMRIDEARISELIAMSKKIISQIDFQFLPYFEIN